MFCDTQMTPKSESFDGFDKRFDTVLMCFDKNKKKAKEKQVSKDADEERCDNIRYLSFFSQNH